MTKLMGNEYVPVVSVIVTGSTPFPTHGPVEALFGSLETILTVLEAVRTGFQNPSVILRVAVNFLPASSVVGVPVTPRGRLAFPGCAFSPGNTNCRREGGAATTVKVEMADVRIGAPELLLSTAVNEVSPAVLMLTVLIVNWPAVRLKDPGLVAY